MATSVRKSISSSSHKVLIVYRFLPQYRVDFYNRLRIQLAEHSIELNLAYGKSNSQDALKNDEADLDWAYLISNKMFKVGGTELIWQPCISLLKSHDLIVVEQANRLLLNYLLMVLRRIVDKKIAFWGHGLNLQVRRNSFRNQFKRMFINQCDWWFAYTRSVKKLIEENGFPKERITVVQNAIDTERLCAVYKNTSKTNLSKLREELSLVEGPVGIYCGGMYPEKRLDFLIAACDRIRQKVPDFQMLFIGSGVDRSKVLQASKERSWLYYLGTKFGDERVPFYKLADVLLMPGLVGLVILDSFATQTPIVTTDFPFHSPEIEYLKSGENGLMVEDSLERYVDAVVGLLRNRKKLAQLRKACAESAKKYTLQQMVGNFVDGIKCCLSS